MTRRARHAFAAADLVDAKASFAKVADTITDRIMAAISANMREIGLRGLDQESTKRLRPFVAIRVATNLVDILGQEDSGIGDPAIRKRRQMEKRRLLSRIERDLTD